VGKGLSRGILARECTGSKGNLIEEKFDGVLSCDLYWDLDPFQEKF